MRINCPRCNTEIDENDYFCSRCGAKLISSQKKKKFCLVKKCIPLFVLMAISAGGLYIINNPGDLWDNTANEEDDDRHEQTNENMPGEIEKQQEEVDYTEDQKDVDTDDGTLKDEEESTKVAPEDFFRVGYFEGNVGSLFPNNEYYNGDDFTQEEYPDLRYDGHFICEELYQDMLNNLKEAMPVSENAYITYQPFRDELVGYLQESDTYFVLLRYEATNVVKNETMRFDLVYAYQGVERDYDTTLLKCRNSWIEKDEQYLVR